MDISKNRVEPSMALRLRLYTYTCTGIIRAKHFGEIIAKISFTQNTIFHILIMVK